MIIIIKFSAFLWFLSVKW
jgi:hypothetical protein